MLRALFVLWQCTWGIMQTLAGLVICAVCRFRGRAACNFHGAVSTEWRHPESLSLGLFIFISDDPPGAAGQSRGERTRRLQMHEYGHCLQSLLLGPLYLPLIVLPSALWCNLSALQRYRREKSVSYYSFYTERWAELWGARVVGVDAGALKSRR